jgi:hypothetical protein
LWTLCLGWPQTVNFPDLSLPSSYDYRLEPPVPGSHYFWIQPPLNQWAFSFLLETFPGVKGCNSQTSINKSKPLTNFLPFACLPSPWSHLQGSMGM